MNANDLDHGSVKAAQAALWAAIGAHGDSIASRLREEKDYTELVARYAISLHDERTANLAQFCETGWASARDAFGPCFIFPRESSAIWRKITYERRHLKRLVETVPAYQTLKAFAERGFVLVAGPPEKASLAGMLQMMPEQILLQGGLASEKFIQHDVVKSGWVAITKDPLENSRGLPRMDQQLLVHDGTDIPNAPETVWALMTFLRVRRSKLLLGVRVRTESRTRDGGFVVVYSPDGHRLIVTRDDPEDKPGILAMRKFNKKTA